MEIRAAMKTKVNPREQFSESPLCPAAPWVSARRICSSHPWLNGQRVDVALKAAQRLLL